MTTLTIDIPENKSKLVKELLTELGVSYRESKPDKSLTYKEKIARVSVWTDEEIKPIMEARKHFEGLGTGTW